MIKSLKPEVVTQWTGLDNFTDAQELPPNAWIESINVVVSPNSNALALRSPANFNATLSNSKPVLSVFNYDRAAGGIVLFDTQTTGTTQVTTYSVAAGTTTNVSLRTGQANARWQSVNVNNKAYRVNGSEFIQYVTGLTVYRVGIDPPLLACTAAITSGTSTLTLSTGVSASYAYRNSTTLHVGQCSVASGNSGPGSSQILRIGVVASLQTGVDGIVVFLTQDGGSVRYLVVDTNGDPIVYSNATANIDYIAAFNLNYNVEETFFNNPPPVTGLNISSWKNRLLLTGFTGALTRQQIQYSGFDQIFYGQPWEAWPPLNIITIPSKSESMMGGIETAVGWLGLSDRDAYLLTGAPTDKVDSGENTLQITEQLRQLKWGIGTRSPLTLQNTQYGTLWLDQNKHLQFWAWQGTPEPVAVGLWEDLETILDTDAARAMAEAVWFQVGKNGGFYVLTASTASTTNNRMWFVTVMKTAQGLFIGGAPSDIAAQCITMAMVSGDNKCLIGVTDRLREILDFDTAGAGWPTATRLYFSLISGATLANYSTLHSLRYDGLNAKDVTVRACDLDGANSVTGNPRYEQSSFYSMLGHYGPQHKVTFEFPTDDVAKHDIKDVRLAHAAKPRVI